MKLWVVETLLIATTVLGGAWVIFHMGELTERRANTAHQALVERVANTKYRVEVLRGQEAARLYLTADRARQTQINTLQEQFDELRNRAPLVIYRPAAVRPAADTAGPGAVVPTPVVASSSGSTVDLVGPGLTAGAVWMWNSALAGTDMPVGACGAASTATEPCTADTGLGLEAAWRNHETNAKSCAADRARQQALIDFVSQHPAQSPP